MRLPPDMYHAPPISRRSSQRFIVKSAAPPIADVLIMPPGNSSRKHARGECPRAAFWSVALRCAPCVPRVITQLPQRVSDPIRSTTMSMIDGRACAALLLTTAVSSRWREPRPLPVPVPAVEALPNETPAAYVPRVDTFDYIKRE